MRMLVVTLCFLQAFAAKAQLPREGDDLRQLYQNMLTPHYFKAPPMTPWTEGQGILMISPTSNPSQAGYLLLALSDTSLIGVYLIQPRPIFLLSMGGSGKLDVSTEYVMVPDRIVAAKAHPNSADSAILLLLDQLYALGLQADDGFPDKTTMQQFHSYRTDTALSNRHIAYLYDSYQTIITETAAKGKKPPAALCLYLTENLSTACQTLYGRVPVIALIYRGEALQSAGKLEEAAAHFKKALSLYPNSIPLQVYQYRMEKDPEKRKRIASDLKKKYPNHWMVKEM